MTELLAEGYNVFDTNKSPSGTVKYLESPADVISLIQSGKLQEHILLVRGGTTTFLAPALSMGAIGVITMSGAPESHLGILSREFQTPCVMTAHLVTSESRYVVGTPPCCGLACADAGTRRGARRVRPGGRGTGRYSRRRWPAAVRARR